MFYLPTFYCKLNPMDPFRVNTPYLPQTTASNIKGSVAQVPALTTANHMPYDIRSSSSNFPPHDIQRLNGEYVREKANFVYSPRSAPSAVLSENALKSKALGQKVYAHSEAATRYELVSNIRAAEPRFRDQVDLLA